MIYNKKGVMRSLFFGNEIINALCDECMELVMIPIAL
jgi:hypothetical protein